jgi:hypothetical protein
MNLINRKYFHVNFIKLIYYSKELNYRLKLIMLHSNNKIR